MSANVFDRETLLDLTVNVIPLGIILFFVIFFLLLNPWGWNEPLIVAVTIGLHVVPFVSLAALTYFSAKAISSDEKRREGQRHE